MKNLINTKDIDFKYIIEDFFDFLFNDYKFKIVKIIFEHANFGYWEIRAKSEYFNIEVSLEMNIPNIAFSSINNNEKWISIIHVLTIVNKSYISKNRFHDFDDLKALSILLKENFEEISSYFLNEEKYTYLISEVTKIGRKILKRDEK